MHVMQMYEKTTALYYSKEAKEKSRMYMESVINVYRY
jgi:hypothetical protein